MVAGGGEDESASAEATLPRKEQLPPESAAPAATVAATTCAAAAGNRRSIAQMPARRPNPRISAATASRRTWSRAVTITSAPSLASWRAIALPMPRLPPVTKAIFPECGVDSAGI